ncbi:ABC transporter ATP-binding protein [Kiloniella laminariae]|uniref:ABC transporter ATP-binding protein n=1 Tax=Kiloniella laminariae TaxID=454162 RepID=UPI0003A2D99A|nr:ABC transporter ATP-binding protein [Kiloniella laminariae]
MSNSMKGLSLASVSKTYRQGTNELHVLNDVSFDIKPGELVALIGPSGAGKSTMLHIAGLLEKPDSGDILVNGESSARLNDKKRTALRRDTIGFVYQYHHLLPEFSAVENVILPQMITGLSRKEAQDRAVDLLTTVGLADRVTHRPAELSGGEQQRVAIARALANAPSVLLADEPTGNLDPETANKVFDLLLNLVRSVGLTALIATHNHELAKRMDRVLHFEGGKIC